MTANGAAGDGNVTQDAAGRLRSVRDGRAGTAIVAAPGVRVSPPVVAMGLLIAFAIVVHGARALGPDWLGGDLLYHGALVRELLLGTFPLEGPYAGLPTYYPPAFHILVAATMSATGLSFSATISLLMLAWLPVLPIGTWLLARRLTGSAWVAVVAVALTLFAGGLDLRPGRLWVNSLFQSGHVAWPLFPRDLVFGLLPFALLAILRALCAPRPRIAVAWAAVGGTLFGLAGLVQVQLLLPLPVAVLAAAVVAARIEPQRRGQAGLVIVVAGGIALAIVAPWLLDQLSAIGRNGGVALDSSEALEPARFGLWQYPRQFWLSLPLAFYGAGAALLLLRRGAAAPHGADPAGGLAVVAWAGVAFALAVLYSPAWPLEDAVRPQRMWLLASQPMSILAAIGLAALAREIVGRRWARPRLAPAAIVLVVLAASVPATVATARLVGATWTRPTYGHVDLTSDRVPAFADLLGPATDRSTVLSYEDWSSLIWYQTGQAVVAIEPAGYAKLAFDPARFTEFGQAERRRMTVEAFRGDVSGLIDIADRTAARTIVLARSVDGRWGLFDAAAVPASAPGTGTPISPVSVTGNGWDGLLMSAGQSIEFPASLPAGPVRFEFRFADHPGLPASWRSSIAARTAAGVVALGRADGQREVDGFSVVPIEVEWPGDASLVLTTEGPLLVQSVRGFAVPPSAPAGWQVATESDTAVVLRREP